MASRLFSVGLGSILGGGSCRPDHSNVDVFVLFKGPQLNVYVPSVTVSHWQIVCYFKDTDEYICYEMIIDRNDRVSYDITGFNYCGPIFFSYLGECNLSQNEMKTRAQRVPLNGEKYSVGSDDCQKWAMQFLNKLELTLKGDGPAFMTFAAHRLTTAFTPSPKTCIGYKRLFRY